MSNVGKSKSSEIPTVDVGESFMAERKPLLLEILGGYSISTAKSLMGSNQGTNHYYTALLKEAHSECVVNGVNDLQIARHELAYV